MGHVILYAGAACVAAGILLFIWFLILSKGTGKRLRKKLEDEYRAAEK